MQGKEKKVRCTNLQKKLLVEYMCSHPEFARGPNAPTPSHEAKWVALKQYLSDYGPDKTIRAWKTTWRDLKRANAPAPSLGGDTPRVSVIDQNEMHQKVLALMRDVSSPGLSSSECSVSNDIQDLPTFITEQASENSQNIQAELLFVEKESDPKPMLDASGNRRGVEILETYCVKKLNDEPNMVLKNHQQLKESEQNDLVCQSQTKYLEEISSMIDKY